MRVGLLREKLNALFRPLLLDSITMLELLEERDLAQRFSKLQHELLFTLHQDPTAEIRLEDSFSTAELRSAAEAYIQLIRNA